MEAIKIIYDDSIEGDGYRILEIEDNNYMMENLKGDMYNPKVNLDINIIELKKEEEEFEQKVYQEGVYGYVLERWNPEVGKGWEEIDSCWGFIGRYGIGNRHYIVEEFERYVKVNR